MTPRTDVLLLGDTAGLAAGTASALASHGLVATVADATGPAPGDGGWAAAVAQVRPRLLLLDVARDAASTEHNLEAFILRLRRMDPASPEAGSPCVVVRCPCPRESGVTRLLAAGASDVMDTDTPVDLLVRRLRTLLLVARQREEIERKLRYEKAVAACARVLVGGGELSRQFDQVIGLLQQATGVSRAYMFRNEADPEFGVVASQIHEGCAAGVVPQIANPELQRSPMSLAAPNAMRELAAGRIFTGVVSRMEEPERSLLGSQGILSILILPIFHGTAFWGFIGFDDCAQALDWNPDEVALLKIVAEATGLAVERTRAEGEIYRMAVQDALTGLHNRRYVLDRLEQLASEAARGSPGFTLALLDLDHFKRVNDAHGHGVGDDVLRHFATAVQHHFRPHDLVGRYGGEEFLVVMLNAGVDQMTARLEALRNTLHRQPFSLRGEEFALRFSAGVVRSRDCGTRAMSRELLDAADRALYQAKREGRNRTVAGTPVPRSAEPRGDATSSDEPETH